MFATEWFEMKNLTAAQQRTVNGKKRILRGCTDQNHNTVLNVGQQHVLLRPVEAVNFIEEKDCPLAVMFKLLAGFRQDVADFLDTRGDCIHGHEPALRVKRYDVSQCG